MTSERMDRRLLALLAADVAGYSRLVGADEEGTLAQWKAHFRELIEPKIAEHHGRIVRVTGDGLLVEFVSVIVAVKCAVELQHAMGERNIGVPPEIGSSSVWASTSATSSSTAPTCGAAA